MNSQKRKTSKNPDREYADALHSMKKIILREGSRVFKEPKEENEKERAQIEEKLLRLKADKIRDLFIQKLKRKAQHGQPIRKPFLSGVDGFPLHLLLKGLVFPVQVTNFILLLNLICLIVLLFLTTFMAYSDHFSAVHSQTTLVKIILAVCLASFIAQFFMKMTNQSYMGGKKKIYLRKIIRAYIDQKRIFIDLGIIFLLAAVLGAPRQRVLSGLLFLYTLFVIIIYSDDLVIVEITHTVTEKQRLILRMLKIFLFNILFAHTLATILLAMAQLDRDNNWITLAGKADYYWWDIYVESFYWATTIMMTVGFGDFLPANSREMLITAFVEIIGCIVLSYNISAIGEILGRMHKSDENVRVKMAIFQKIIRRGKNKSHKNKNNLLRGSKFNKDMFENQTYIDPNLEENIFNYIRELNINNEGLEYSQRNKFLEELPDHLRKSFYKQANRVIFPTVTFFNNLKATTLEKLAENLSSKYLHPGQYIGQEETSNIVILEFGKIGLAYNRKGSTINGEIMQKILVKEDDTNTLITNSFLYLSKPQKYDMVALSYSLTWRIEKGKMFEILSSSKMDNEYYFNTLHKHTMDQDEWEIIKCDICDKFHTVFDCYRLTYMPMRELSIARDRFRTTINHDRRPHRRKRSPIPTISALKFRKNFYKVVERFTINANKKDILEQEVLNREKARLIEDQLRDEQRNKKSIEDSKFIFNIDEQRFKKIMMQVIKEYDTGYQEGFWDLEADSAKNYQFYFPANNSNKFIVTPLGKIYSKPAFQKEKSKKLEESPSESTLHHLLSS